MSLVTDLKNTIAKKEAEVSQLKQALIILEGSAISVEAPAPLQAAPAEKPADPPPSHEPIGKAKPVGEAYIGPRCSACGGKMYQTAKIMPSGAYASLFRCNDSACNNEVYS